MVGQLIEVREVSWTLLRYGSEQHHGVREGGARAYEQAAAVEGVSLEERHTVHVDVHVWSWTTFQDA